MHFESGERLHTADALILGGSLSTALLSLGLLSAADAVDSSRIGASARRLPAAMLVFGVALSPISAHAVITILAIIAAAEGTYDVWASPIAPNPARADQWRLRLASTRVDDGVRGEDPRG